MNEYLKLAIWAAVIGAAFAFAWRKGYLVRLSGYVQETREELKKCTWPSVEELKGSTVVIMITILLLGVFVIGADFVILKFVRGILPKL